MDELVSGSVLKVAVEDNKYSVGIPQHDSIVITQGFKGHLGLRGGVRGGC
jgi:hypothetical protein